MLNSSRVYLPLPLFGFSNQAEDIPACLRRIFKINIVGLHIELLSLSEEKFLVDLSAREARRGNGSSYLPGSGRRSEHLV